ncbi:uncharacterized protein LOC110623037 isoform X3 [Manihot esculenta]|uniref:SUZ domain-containing protein n=1 Tax=Manihot esculenta TaxID=3983 RepID=A0A2C9VBY1_MANES|nr:uncharacterized protein LOC110623037 isoform X3 [Manihot esculenta]OAY42490.1 hypothetical protein MANES_09G184300v8 [Manihot esculenta]
MIPDGILELEPMDPYSRLLLHRLADIFGFAHVSVGEGDERHLILERCPETSIPSILVSDILFQHEESQPLTTSHQLLRRNNAPPVLKAKSPSSLTLEQREAAYLAARERIFSIDVEEMKEPQKQKPRSVPVVARRMIAHALGQKISPWNQDVSIKNCKGFEAQTTELNVQDKDKIDLNSGLEEFNEARVQPGQDINPLGKGSNNHDCNASSPAQRNLPHDAAGKSSTNISTACNGSSRNRVKEYSKEEHMGAAKRMFANALGLQSAKGGLMRCSAAKQPDLE